MINLWWLGIFSKKLKKVYLVYLKDNSLVIITLWLIYLWLWTEISVSLHLGIRLSDYGTSKPERLWDNSLDTRKKFTLYASPLITDKLFLLVLIKKLNFGTHWLIANIPVNLITIKTGFLKLDILLNWRLKLSLLLNLTLPQLDGTEDWRSGTPVSKSEILSNLTRVKSTLWLFLPMPNIWLLEEKTKYSTSGMSLT